jgi:hypothetical protein
MKKIYISVLILLAASPGAMPQGFMNNLKKDIKKEEIAINEANQKNNNGNLQRWVRVNAGGEIPGDAVAGGKDSDGSQLFVSRGNYGGFFHPGKTRRDWNGVSIEYGGKELMISSYEVLVGNAGLYWSNVTSGNMPPNAVPGGADEHRSMFICRCMYQGSTQIGKTWQGNLSCNIGYGGNGYDIPNYEVLAGGAPNNSQAGNQPNNYATQQNNNYPAQPNGAPAQQNNFAAQSNQNQPPPQVSPLTVYNNYDFVPGETILFEDNFADDQDGEFPSKWDLAAGQAVLNRINGELALFITQGNYAKLIPRLKTKSYLTDPFTVEMDYYVQEKAQNGILLFLTCNDNSDRIVSFKPSGEVETS